MRDSEDSGGQGESGGGEDGGQLGGESDSKHSKGAVEQGGDYDDDRGDESMSAEYRYWIYMTQVGALDLYDPCGHYSSGA